MAAGGLRNTLSEGPRSTASAHNNRHPLEARLRQWDDVEMDFKLESYRRLYGAGEPIRRAMELEIVSKSQTLPQSLADGPNVHLDILKNRDSAVEWEDVFTDKPSLDSSFHAAMERKMGI